MNLSTHIAKRYLFGKKSHNAINIVSIISVVGVTIGTMAFILILSIFNGFDQLVQSMYNSFYPDILVTPAQGKTFVISDDTLSLINNTEGVEEVAQILEDNALLQYNNKQTVSMLRGVSDNYHKVNSIDSLVWHGEYELYYQNMPRAIIGRSLSYHLGVNPDLFPVLKIHIPRRTAGFSNDPNKTLNRKLVQVSGVFASQPDIDGKYTIVPLSFARKLFEYSNELSLLEIKIKNGAVSSKVIDKLNLLLGDNFVIKNRYQQNELLYKTMKTEKWAIFLILALVLVILLFCMVGAISMLIIEKKKDINILFSLGADQKLVKNIFYREGLLITITGMIIGLIIGSAFCYLQEQFGLIRLQGGFVIDAYPVDLQFNDLIIVITTVMVIGSFSSWYPIRYLLQKQSIQDSF